MSSLSYLQITEVIKDVNGIIRNDEIPLRIILVNSIANTLEFIIVEKLY